MSVRFRNCHGEDRVVPWIGGVRCLAGETITVPDEHYVNYCLSGWEPLDPDPSEPPSEAASNNETFGSKHAN